MPTLRVKQFVVRDAVTLERLKPRPYLLETLAQKEADKLCKKGKAAVVVPLEED